MHAIKVLCDGCEGTEIHHNGVALVDYGQYYMGESRKNWFLLLSCNFP